MSGEGYTPREVQEAAHAFNAKGRVDDVDLAQDMANASNPDRSHAAALRRHADIAKQYGGGAEELKEATRADEIADLKEREIAMGPEGIKATIYGITKEIDKLSGHRLAVAHEAPQVKQGLREEFKVEKRPTLTAGEQGHSSSLSIYRTNRPDIYYVFNHKKGGGVEEFYYHSAPTTLTDGRQLDGPHYIEFKYKMYGSV